MGEKKLNLSAPFLSVRRTSTSALPDGEIRRAREFSMPNRRRTLPSNNSDANTDQVTEPATVPFLWEQFPGRPKNDNGTLPMPHKNRKIPAPIAFDDVDKSSVKDSGDQIGCNPRLEALSLTADVYKLDSFKKGTDEDVGSSKEECDDDDTYSDALETLSPNGSFSLNCSASGLSQTGASGSKLNKTSLTDSKSRDFMMSRFLPAAKAMTLDSPQYALKKQPAAIEQPTQAIKVMSPCKRISDCQYGSNIVAQHGLEEENEESEDEQSDVEDHVRIPTKGCGLFPRLCFKNSLGILNPIPGLKIRTQSIKSSSCKSANSGKTAPVTSHNQIPAKLAQVSSLKHKPISANQSPKLPEIKNKLANGSQRRAFSGELPMRRSFSPFRRSEHAQSASPSPKAAEFTKKPVSGSQRFAFSGELHHIRSSSPFRRPEYVQNGYIKHKSSSLNQSPKLPEVKNKLGSGTQRLAYSGELQTTRSTSPFRRSVSGTISPYRNVATKSPFHGVGFLGVPKVDTCRVKKNIDNKNRKISPHLPCYQRTEVSSSPAAEKTLYIDTVNNAASLLKGSVLATQNFEASESTGKEVNDTWKSSFKDVIRLESANLRYEEDLKREFKLSQGLDQECRSLKGSERSSSRKFDVYKEPNSTGDIPQKENFSSGNPSLPLPLPKSPSESWLWRTLPSISSRNLISHSYGSSQDHSKHQDSNNSSSNTKWETIVKSSKLHKDHVRYSEELITRASQQL